MSLFVQSLSSGNALPTTGASTTSGTGTSSSVPFAQALVQTMGGNTANTDSITVEPTLSDLASLFQGLLNQVQTTDEKTGDKATDSNALLEQLTDNMSQLDESLNNDPALLAALQGWLLQVSTLLAGSDGAVESGASDGTGSLSPLAQNAETLRFAVQDDLNSLVALIQEAAVQGNEETVSKGVTLLNNFTALLDQTNVNGNKNKAKPSNAVDGTQLSIAQSQVVDSKGETKDKPLIHLNNRSGEVNALKNEAVIIPSSVGTGEGENAEVELTNTALAKAVVAGDLNKSDSSLDTALETTVIQGDHEVVTAGQLSLRGGITAPLKAEVPVAPVPVQQFAQEMSGFITGKLEFVQKGGIAEATISLFPENLGQVDVKITMQNGHLVAQFMTEHSGAKDLLEQQMNQLRAALQSQGLQVEKLEVTQNNTPLNSQWGQEGRQPGSGSGQQGRRSKESREEASDAVLAAELNGEWKDWVSNTGQEDQNQAGSFSAKA